MDTLEENGYEIPGQAHVSENSVNFKERDTVEYIDTKVMTYQSANTS
jgi:hypothetical protein